MDFGRRRVSAGTSVVMNGLWHVMWIMVEAMQMWDRGADGKSLYLLLTFAVNFKLL